MSWLFCFPTSLVASYLLPPATCFNLFQAISVQEVAPPKRKNCLLSAFVCPSYLVDYASIQIFLTPLIACLSSTTVSMNNQNMFLPKPGSSMFFPKSFSARKALCQSARAAMKKLAMLDPQHLAIEDLEELSNLPSQSSWVSTISLNGSGSIGSISWQFLRPETEISLWMSGLLLHLLKLGSLAPKLQSQS